MTTDAPPPSWRVAFYAFGLRLPDRWRPWALARIDEPSWPNIYAGRNLVAFLIGWSVAQLLLGAGSGQLAGGAFGAVVAIGLVRLAFPHKTREWARRRQITSWDPRR